MERFPARQHARLQLLLFPLIRHLATYHRTDLESEGQDYKYDFFCMLDGKDRKFNWFTFNGSDPDPMSVPDQLSFSGSEIIDEKGIPFIPFVFMYPDATKSSNTNMDVLAMSSWKDSCGDDVCSYYPNETPSFSKLYQVPQAFNC
jgi:hypothetical protein